MDFSRCNIADIVWYMRIPTDPPPVDSKVKIQPTLCKAVGATWNQPSPQQSASALSRGKYVCWNKRKTMLVGQTKMQLADLEKKEMMYHCEYMYKL